MVGTALLMYGFNGFKAGAAASFMAERIMPDDVTDDVRGEVELVLEQGLIGAIINNMYQSITGSEEKFDVSGKYNPYNQVGGVPVALKKLLISVVEGNTYDTLVDMAPDVPGFGLVGPMGDVLHAAFTMYGVPNTTITEASVQTAIKFFKAFPLTNDLMKAAMVAHSGIVTATDGTPVSEVGKDAWVFSLLGIQSYDQRAYRDLLAKYHGEFTGRTQSGWKKAAEDQAKETAKWMREYSRNPITGELDMVKLARIREDHNIAFYTSLAEDDYKQYNDALTKQLMGGDVLKLDKLVDQMQASSASGDISATTLVEDVGHIIKDRPDGRQILRDLEAMIESRQETE